MIFRRTGFRLLPFILCCCAVLCTEWLSAQSVEDTITFDRITIPGTMRSAQITSIVQDKYGYLWFGGNGLFRFDGIKFKNFQVLENSEGLLTPNDTDCLFYDSLNNRLLIGTRNLGIVAYEYATDRLHILPTKPAVNNSGLPIINDITQTADGKVWAISFNSGLLYLENDTLKNFDDPDHLFSQPTSLLADGSTVLIGQMRKVLLMENNTLRDSLEISWEAGSVPGYTRVTAMHIDHHHKLWIGTEKQGIFVYHLKEKKFVQYFKPTQAPFFSRINSIVEDSQGLVWITTKANGVAVYNQQTDVLRLFTNNPLSPESISSDNCFHILEDRSGIIWIGATGDVNKYDRQRVSISHIRHNPLQEPSLSDNMVRGVYEDRTGKIWMGTDGGYLNILNRERKIVEKIKVVLPELPGNFVPMYFLELDDQRMLMGTSLGLIQYNHRKREFSPFRPLWELTRDKMVRQLLYHDGDIFVLYEGNLLVYNLASGKYYQHIAFGKATPQSATIMYLDSQNRLWIGVRGGLSYFYPPKKEFRYLPLQASASQAPNSLTMVLSLHDLNGKLYAGTFNDGFWEIDISNLDSIPEPIFYTEKNGLPSNTVYASLADHSGNLWLSTNNGIAKFSTATKRFEHFTVSEGLQHSEFNRLAFYPSKTGELIFGGINGINIFRPGDLAVPLDLHLPVITGLLAINPSQREDSPRAFHLAEPDLSLSFDENYITFQFLVPIYREPKRFKTFYKLSQFDSDWKEAQFDYSASYANLGPGNYTFTVKTVSNEGTEQSTSFPFVIRPPIWQTWWFIALTVCVVAFLIMTIIRSYIRRAQFDKLHLEEQLKLHTEEIEKSREELMALNQKKDLIFSILSHDLRSPLTTLKGFLGLLIDNADFLSKEDVKRHAINIRHSVTNSLDLIDNTLFWSLSQMGNIQYNPKAFALKPVLEKIIELYLLTAQKKKLQLTLECDESIILYADDNMIYVTLRNLISNGIKFTPEGKSIFIEGKINKGFAEVKVIDQGVGMSPEYLSKVLSMDQPMLKTGTSNEKGTGLGLLLCKNFLEINNGTLQIHSVENAGTTFTITLPLAKSELVPH